MNQENSAVNIGYISVGVEDLEAAKQFWADELGLDVALHREGSDPGLAKLWNIAPDMIVNQLLLRTPDAETGWLHLVEFASPGEAVRRNASATDLGAKNLDVNCTGIREKIAALRLNGHSFRSEISEYEIDGIRACEVQMPGHDDLNIVFIEVLTPGFEVSCSARGYAAVTSFVVIVPDVDKEADFYQLLFGQHEILRHCLSGPAIERAAALPPGTLLDLRLLGSTRSLFGRMELIRYVGVDGDNRFERMQPPATGILGCGFFVPSLDRFLDRAKTLGVETERVVEATAVFGSIRASRVRSPAGLTIDVMELKNYQSVTEAAKSV